MHCSISQKRWVPARHTHTCSVTGWIDEELYSQWFDFFLKKIPPTRPVLLIADGHTSHTSIEVIEKARANNVHLLCLPSHTTHLLQPLDVSVFKPFKSNFNKACRELVNKNPGRVVTTNDISSLIAKAWPLSLTPINIMSGFKKCGISPLNPGATSDQQLAPSKSVTPQVDDLSTPGKSGTTKSSDTSTKTSDVSSTKTVAPCSHLDEILSLPKAKPKTRPKRNPGLTTYSEVLSGIPFISRLWKNKAEKEWRNKGKQEVLKGNRKRRKPLIPRRKCQ